MKDVALRIEGVAHHEPRPVVARAEERSSERFELGRRGGETRHGEEELDGLILARLGRGGDDHALREMGRDGVEDELDVGGLEDVMVPVGDEELHAQELPIEPGEALEVLGVDERSGAGWSWHRYLLSHSPDYRPARADAPGTSLSRHLSTGRQEI